MGVQWWVDCYVIRYVLKKNWLQGVRKSWDWKEIGCWVTDNPQDLMLGERKKDVSKSPPRCQTSYPDNVLRRTSNNYPAGLSFFRKSLRSLSLGWCVATGNTQAYLKSLHAHKFIQLQDSLITFSYFKPMMEEIQTTWVFVSSQNLLKINQW